MIARQGRFATPAAHTKSGVCNGASCKSYSSTVTIASMLVGGGAEDWYLMITMLRQGQSADGTAKVTLTTSSASGCQATLSPVTKCTAKAPTKAPTKALTRAPTTKAPSKAAATKTPSESTTLRAALRTAL